MPDTVYDFASRLLERSMDPVPYYRLLRDVLQYPDPGPDCQAARSRAMQSHLVEDLCRSQLPDGSWGRFYTRNKQVKFAGKTTETALIRALSLGMPGEHPSICKAIGYLESILSGSVQWPDRPEHTLDWPIGVKLVTAARLSQFDANHPAVAETAACWQTILEAAFSTPEFDGARFHEAYEACFNQYSERGPALGFSLYSLLLLRNRLPYDIEERLINHLIHNMRGIYLVNNHSLQYLPLQFPSRECLRYIASLELLAYYPSAFGLLEKANSWLWEHVNNEGLWDLGQFSRDNLELPLSESWRTRGSRELDCTVRILCLLVRLQRTCEISKTICHNL